jgi:hypothetical protein
MALVGNLRDLKLPNLIQLNCMERNTAKLTIEHAGKFGIIYFQDGQIAHAEYEPDIGDAALFRLMELQEGKFKVENGVRPPLISIKTHWNNLLLEGLHQLDTQQLSDDGKNIQLLNMIMNIKGVKNVALLDKKGTILKGELLTDKDSSVHAFAYRQVEKINSIIKREKPQYISYVSKTKRTILKEYDENIIYIDIEPRIQLEIILPFIEQVVS